MTSTLSPAFERTLCLIKPDAVAHTSFGDILKANQQEGIHYRFSPRQPITYNDHQ